MNEMMNYEIELNEEEMEEVNGIKFVAKKLSDIQAKEMKAIVDDMKDKYKLKVIQYL